MKKLIFVILVFIFSITLFKTIYAQSDCNPDEPGTGTDGLCHEECGADPGCDGLEPDEGCCSGCYYTDLNNDGIVNILDVSTIATYFGLCDPSHKDYGKTCDDCYETGTCYDLDYDFNADGIINIIELSTIAKKYQTDCTTTAIVQQTQTEKLGFNYSNVLVVLIVVLVLVIILLSFKFFVRKT